MLKDELISTSEFLQLLCQEGVGVSAVDVRSESEFFKGAVPLAHNLPILKDAERKAVGTCYKQIGPEAAKTLGYTLVGPEKDLRSTEWVNALQDKAVPIVYCWRGGLRSQIAQEWCREKGLQVKRIEGGFKSVRNQLAAEFRKPLSGLCLSGLTGTGKTVLLQKLGEEFLSKNKSKNSCPFILDFEALAKHRGSAFGLLPGIQQPNPIDFENALGLTLFRYHRYNDQIPAPLLFEDESKAIGNLRIPLELFQSLQMQPRVELVDSIDSRIQRIFEEYVLNPSKIHGVDITRNYLTRSLQSLIKRIGRERLSTMLAQLEQGFAANDFGNHADWIRELLLNYYDPRYAYACERWPRNIIFQGKPDAVFAFLQAQYSATI